MNLAKSVLIPLAIALSAPVASTSEAVWPRNSVSEFSTFATLLRFRIYADHCSANAPQLKPEFEGLVETVSSRIQVISKGLLSSDVSKGIRNEPVPAEIIDAFKDSFDDMKHNVERRDAAATCPKALQSLGDVNDESLKSDLSQMITAVQNMMRKLDQEGTR